MLGQDTGLHKTQSLPAKLGREPLIVCMAGYRQTGPTWDADFTA